MRLLVDMNLSPSLVVMLEERGISAVHWSLVGDPGADDAVILKYAADNEFVIVTNDLDFSSILASTGGGGPSVIQIRADDLRPAILAPKILLAIAASAGDIKSGALVTVDTAKNRVRLLPLLKQ